MVEKKRKTKETEIKVKIELYGKGKSEINTGIGFFDHMLEIFAKHSFVDLFVWASGDKKVDSHHIIEDVGIVIGKSIDKALEERRGIRRFGFAAVPLDDALTLISIDLGNRAYLKFDADLPKLKLGEFDVEMTKEFFQSLSNNAKMTLHIKLLQGENTHHCIESIFKSFAKAFEMAITKEKRIQGEVPSTKGLL
ncbi:MAG: imidazoleglycerol-phosphate dehydratase HisB [Candidatus Hydrogenedentota bacterium]